MLGRSHHRFQPGGLVLAVGLSVWARAYAAPEVAEVAKLVSTDPFEFAYFGGAVSVWQDVAVVGEPFAFTPECLLCGAAHVFRWNGSAWAHEQKLWEGPGWNSFGWAVAASGTRLLIADPDASVVGPDYGAAYVYRWTGTAWEQEQILTASDAVPEMFFACDVAVDGDVAVVGALQDDCEAGSDCGSAYVYRYNGSSWEEEQKLTASDADAHDYFGESVSISGDVLLIGVKSDECDTGDLCGSARVYRFNGDQWAEEQKLSAPAPAAGDKFGVSVDIAGNVAVVGSIGYDYAGCDYCGAAYIFRFTEATWQLEQSLVASDAEAGGAFGISVEISDDAALVGAHTADCEDGSPSCGAAYVFRRLGSTWHEIARLIASDAEPYSYLGVDVSLGGDIALVGASGRSCEAGEACGAAYVYNLPEAPAIPTVSGWGVLMMTLLVLVSGTFVLRRRFAPTFCITP